MLSIFTYSKFNGALSSLLCDTYILYFNLKILFSNSVIINGQLIIVIIHVYRGTNIFKDFSAEIY